MRASEILNITHHRSFDCPKRPWKFYQEWNKAVFLHWKTDPETLHPLLPKSLSLDTIDGQAWISLVAFDMNHIGVRALPKLPHISDFQEINIRTYVTYNDKPGVYFLSMEGSKRASCKVLKAISKFPYKHSKMTRTDFSYDSHNISENNTLQIIYRNKATSCHKDNIDLWLTERYTVFNERNGKLIEYDVHHLEWPLEEIDIKQLKLDYPKWNHLINDRPDRRHYSQGVKVLTWDKRKHRT
ncbi:MAG TPA: DUF2071 domain-containing protein [Aquaticitalea sp.]|nr:DUF2071 domain-containing protein [Aquaticitalea sp.]HNU58595.1 DUF2071 domain-containing protein [Aquaticitalea sp.]